MDEKKEEVGEGIESVDYKIMAFHNENQESFAQFYKMAEALISALRLTAYYSEEGMDSQLLTNVVQSVRKLTPAAPFQENITAKYVQSVIDICNEAEELAVHFQMDHSQVPPKLDKWTKEALARTARLCEKNNEILRSYYYEHERPYSSWKN